MIIRQFLPAQHPRVATAALGLASALNACGASDEARPLAAEALQIRTALMPAAAWQIVEARRLAAR